MRRLLLSAPCEDMRLQQSPDSELSQAAIAPNHWVELDTRCVPHIQAGATWLSRIRTFACLPACPVQPVKCTCKLLFQQALELVIPGGAPGDDVRKPREHLLPPEAAQWMLRIYSSDSLLSRTMPGKPHAILVPKTTRAYCGNTPDQSGLLGALSGASEPPAAISPKLTGNLQAKPECPEALGEAAPRSACGSQWQCHASAKAPRADESPGLRGPGFAERSVFPSSRYFLSGPMGSGAV